jgi:hypothetical protein
MTAIQRPDSEEYRKSSVRTEAVKINDNGEVTIGKEADCGCPHAKQANEMDS